MDKSDECDIVKDLAVSYTEKMINSNSKLFVEKHLEDCNDCKKYYQNIDSNILNENKSEKRKEEYELDFLKKIRKNMNFFKILLVTILIIISIVLLNVIIKYKNINQIVNNAYDKIEYLKNLNNYKLTQKTIDINYEENSTNEITTNYYYKDGKYKVDFGDTILYYEDDSYNKVSIFNDLKQIDYCTQNFIEYKKGETFNIFSEIISYKNELTGLYKLILSNRKDKFNGIDCYVIKFGNNNSYREVWIGKDTYIVMRTIESEASKYYRECVYTLVEDKVKDVDVDSSIIKSNEYDQYEKNNITYNATKEIIGIYSK